MSAPERRPMVLVTVGTDHHPFERLMDWVDAWLADPATPAVRCVVQHGTSRAPTGVAGQEVEAHDYLTHPELIGRLREATAVVCHGGPATIADARTAGRLPIVVPREHDRGEHVDDHQVAFSVHLERHAEASVTRSEDAFRAALSRAVADPGSVTLEQRDDSTREAVARFGELVAGLFQRSTAAPASARPIVLYIGGLGRSGSTLLDRILGELPDFVSAGEVVHLWERGVGADELCGCGERFSSCAFWAEVGRRAFGGWEAAAPRMLERRRLVDRNRFIPKLVAPQAWPSFDRELRAYATDLGALYRAVSEVSGARVVVDSSKHSSLAYLLRHVPGIDLRVVQIVRSSHGVVHSWQRQVRKPEVVDGVAYMPTYSPTRSASLWSVHNALIGGLSALGVPSMVVKYEDLVRDPRREVGRVLGLVGLDAEAVDTGFLGPDHVDLGPSHTVAGNPMRFRRGRVQLRSDEEWRESMGTRERTVVSALTWPLAARYGYRESR